MQRYFYEPATEGGYVRLNGGLDWRETADHEAFIVFDGKRGSETRMAVCGDRDDAEKIVEALNAAAEK